jgi:phosphoribosyl-ATP pyrophosphohydrolase/phosphoribosyl-AMP cyclohydrolase
MADIIERIQFDSSGLVPAIVQDVQSKAVLMIAYMNQEAVRKTLETGQTWFWSRSRQELWHKGATSGNVQLVKEVLIDCDQDALLVLVEPQGPACHRGTYTCFTPVERTEAAAQRAGGAQKDEAGPSYSCHVISELIEVIARRDMERPEGAYTTYLFEQGLDKILKKVGEEASEVIIAAKNDDHEELRHESADLLYHLLVLWRERGLGLDQILQVLSARNRR